jgi:hypothetical protein
MRVTVGKVEKIRETAEREAQLQAWFTPGEFVMRL